MLLALDSLATTGAWVLIFLSVTVVGLGSSLSVGVSLLVIIRDQSNSLGDINIDVSVFLLA